MAPSRENGYRAKVILGWTTLHFAEETESWESVEILLNGGYSTRDLATTKRKLKDPLRAPAVVKQLCRRGCLKLLRFALSENPELVNTKLEMGRTLLHVAAHSGSSVAVGCLLDYPVDVNASDGRGVTPLHEAAAQCDAHVLMLLLKKGADAQARDVDGRTALHYAASGGSPSGIRVLLAEGLNPDIESANGCSPLHEAASSSSPSANHCVQMLLNAGADLHMTTNAGWTALHWAASEGTARSLRLLLEAGIQPGVRTHLDETPLHLAAERGDSDMVTLLVNHGADVEALDSAGRTPAKRAADSLQKQQQKEAAAAATVEKKGEGKQRTHHKETDNSRKSQATASEKTNTVLSSSTPRTEVVQEDDAQFCADEVEGSEYSFQSEPETSGQVYSDNGSDIEEENYMPENAPEGASARNKPPSLFSVETKPPQYGNQPRGQHQRGKYRGRGRGNFRGHRGSRGGGHFQSQEGKPQYSREYTQSPDKTQHTGNVQQGENRHRHRQRHRHHQAKDGEAKAEYNTEDGSGDPRRKENFAHTASENTRMKHPFSKDRQMHTSDETCVTQNMLPTPAPRNLQRREGFGSTDQINRGRTVQVNRQESRSGGTFLDELRYLQEKLASVDVRANQSPKPIPPPKPRPPPTSGL